MAFTGPTNVLLERSRTLASNADFLSVAVTNDDKDQIEAAFEDLLASYDQYAGQAASYSSRLNFDEVARQETSQERDQTAANALASALVDLETAVLLSQAAQLVGEMEGDVGPDELDQSVATLNNTVNALQGAVDGVPGVSRLAFDEVTGSQTQETLASVDLTTAKDFYKGKTKEVYEQLMTDASSLLVSMFNELSGLDEKQLREGLDVVRSGINLPAVGKAIPRMLDALKRAINTIKDLLGEEGFKKIDEEFDAFWDALKKGEGGLHAFLNYSFSNDLNLQKISTWVDVAQSDISAIDNGARRLANLHTQIVQYFTVSKKIVTSLKSLSAPIKWLLKKFGGTAPVDFILASLYFLVACAALLRGMDYADTTTVVKLVEGTITISEQALGATD